MKHVPVIDSADEFKQWWDAPLSLERVQALRQPIAEAVLRDLVERFPECRADVAARRDTPVDLLARLRSDDDEWTRWRVRTNQRWLADHPDDAEPWLDDPGAPIQLRLTQDERNLLRFGLMEWGGPTNATEELAVAMGFASLADLYDQTKRIAEGIKAGQALTRTDWTRALLATEIVFASNVVGSGHDWNITTGIADSTALDLLRAIQHKVPTGGVLGNVFGSRPDRRPGRLPGDLRRVHLKLWRSDAVVLFDWLMTVDLDSIPIAHPAEKQALADLLSRLEQETDIPGVTQEEIDRAREVVARHMGW